MSYLPLAIKVGELENQRKKKSHSNLPATFVFWVDKSSLKMAHLGREAGGLTVLPDRPPLIGQTWMENAPNVQIQMRHIE